MRNNLGSILLIGGVTFLVVVAILFFGLMVSAPPRGIVFYASFGVAAAVTMIIGLLAVNAKLGRGQGQPGSSPAAMAITFGVAVGYVVTVLAATFVYAMVRSHDGDDSVFSGVLFAITAVWFAVGIVLYSHDLGGSVEQNQINLNNDAGRALAGRVARIRAFLDGMRGDGPEDRQALLEVCRRLGVIEGQWAHLRTGEQASAAELVRAGSFCTELETILDTASAGASPAPMIASIRQALSRFQTNLPIGN